MKKAITKQEAQDMLTGSLFLGCGGGGSDKIGQDLIDRSLAIGVSMCSLSDIDENGLLVTISPVGSPASKESYCGESTYTRIIELLEKKIADMLAFEQCHTEGKTSDFQPLDVQKQAALNRS